ncbi:hypothetical protein BGZ99_003232 [Dissophora globulifera]|uniref:Uncharacterized protein n=1 Tax=Dissophora globulifera TaxID=979702 RepID=A0A9P6UWN7_9FUNG|nr:hypothetical protein BGZ99_003232 [Dissophora globulifera]
MIQSTPSPIPFLLLGLVTGGALLYVSYWVWPPAQRRNSDNSRASRRSGRRQASSGRSTGATGSGQAGLRRSNATRRSSTTRQTQPQQQQHASRRDDSRSYQSDGSSSDEEPSRRRGHDSEDGDTTDHEYAALVDEDGYERLRMDDFGDSKHDGLQLMNLLYAIAEDQAGKGGITCNSCRTVPIRGLRYKCANCQDYDLCEGCEAAEVHTKSHVFMKIRIPIPPLANSRTKKLPPFYPGIPQGNTSTPDHLLQELLQKTHFDNVELDAMYNQYLSLSTLDQEGGGITRLTFEAALGPSGLEKNLITDRIFRFFDQDDDGIINFKEMACGLSVLCKGNFDEKIDFAFQGYDLDGDGYISREELHEMFKAYFYLSMELIRDVVKTMENDLISNFEYQPGMPISSTFTAPIPREIGVRNNNANANNTTNGNHPGNGHDNGDEGSHSSGGSNHEPSNTNANNDELGDPNLPREDETRDRETTSLPAEWPLSMAHSDVNDNTASATPLPVQDGETDLSAVRTSEHDSVTMDDQRLAPGSYGLVDADAYIDDVDGIDDAEDEEEAETSAATDGDTEKSHGNGSEALLSPVPTADEPASEDSEAEDSGVDSNGWHAGTLSLPAVSAAPHTTSTWTSGSPTGGTGTGIDSQRPSLTAASSENTAAASSSSRPRKDQPLPTSTSAPHLAASSMPNTSVAWDRPTHRSGSSPSYFHPSPVTPTLAPALAIGFGISPDASSSASSSSSSASSAQNHDGANGQAGRGTEVYGRRPSMGTPYQSFASSSLAPAGSYANASYFSSTFPVMESISQDAIQEMVEKTFSAIRNPSKPGFITLEEFRAYVLTDAGILGWFDALGSIF